MKILKAIKNFFKSIIGFIDKHIIVPITKLVISITKFFERSSKKIENWLSKPKTLLFLSMIIAIVIFIVVDQKKLLFSESSAEVLQKIPVRVNYNEEAYVVEGIPETVDITLIGRKADLYFAKQSPSQEVSIDLTGLKPGTHKVNIKYNQALASIDYSVNPSSATVVIYQKISETKTLTYDILNQDKLDSKLVISNVNIGTNSAVIKGAEYQLAKVASVKVLIDVNNFVKQEQGQITLKDVPLKAYDENGNAVDVEIVPGKIDVTIDIESPSKELPIKVIPKGEVTFGYAISSINISETKVTVYGDKESLASLTYIPVEVNVQDLKASQQYKLEIEKPVGVKHMSVNNVTVDVSIDESSTGELKDVVVNHKNLADGYTVQGLTTSDTLVNIGMTGVKSVIEKITNDDVYVYVDLSGYGEGTHEVPIQVEGTDSKVQFYSKTATVKVYIKK